MRATPRIHQQSRRLAVVGVVVLIVVSGCTSGRSRGAAPTTEVSTIAPDPSTSTTVELTTTTTAAPTTTLPPTTSAAPTTTTTTIPPTTTTTIPIITEGALVIVANASAVPGAAGRLTKRLGDLGFPVNEATNAAGTEESLDVSKVYFRPPAEAAANSIGLLMGGIAVSRMPTPAPIVGANVALGDATVIVMLGKDLAGKGLPGIDN